MADDDPFASIAKPVATQDADPFASIAKPIAQPPEPGWRDQIMSAVDDPSNVPDTGWRGTVERFGQRTAHDLASTALHPIDTARAVMTPPADVNQALQGDAALAKDYVAHPENLAGDMAAGAITGHLLGGASDATRAVAGKPQLVPGENYAPEHHQALSAALARGTGMGKDFFAPDVAADIASPVRQAAADNPALAKTIHEGTAKDALGATQAVLKEAQNKVDTQHQAALKPVANVPADMKAVQSAVPSPESFHDPSEVTQLKNLSDRAGKVQTLGDMYKFKQYLDKEQAPDFRQNAVAAGRSSVLDDAQGKALSALRDQYYQQLEDATGLDFQPAKRMESSLLKAREALGNAAPNLVNRDAIAGENQGKFATGADVLEGGNKLSSGALPGIGYLAEKLRGTPLDQLHRQLKIAFSDLPKQSVYNGPLAGQWQPAPKKLPSAVPGNAPFGASPTPGGTGPAPPATVTPPPPQRPALPATASPDGVGIPPGQPTNPPPPLNQPTARMNVNAGTPKPPQEQIPPRTIQVNPQGQAAIQRPALPPPETHAWSRAAWTREHPNGNVKTAEGQARAKGYKVVD